VGLPTGEEAVSEKEEDIQRVKDACNTLSEFFDSVQIFATRFNGNDGDDAGTVNIQWGTGNWFCRYGQVKLWTIKQDEDARIDMRADE
jgi:hypothetical protein